LFLNKSPNERAEQSRDNERVILLRSPTRVGIEPSLQDIVLEDIATIGDSSNGIDNISSDDPRTHADPEQNTGSDVGGTIVNSTYSSVSSVGEGVLNDSSDYDSGDGNAAPGTLREIAIDASSHVEESAPASDEGTAATAAEGDDSADRRESDGASGGNGGVRGGLGFRIRGGNNAVAPGNTVTSAAGSNASDDSANNNTATAAPAVPEEAATEAAAAVPEAAVPAEAPTTVELPSHLAANRSPEELQALRQRMTREMAIDEARNLEPRRRIGRNAQQIYVSTAGSTVFLVLLLIRHYRAVMSWLVVFAPLAAQFLALFYLNAMDTRDIYKVWLLHRQSAVQTDVSFACLRQLLSKAHESLWALCCCAVCPLLAMHLDALHDTRNRGGSTATSLSLVESLVPVWVYGVISVLAPCLVLTRACCLVATRACAVRWGSFCWGPSAFFRRGSLLVQRSAQRAFSWGGADTAAAAAASAAAGLERARRNNNRSNHSWSNLHPCLGCHTFAFALLVRVLPVALIVYKVVEESARYSWVVAFTPYWAAIGVLLLVGGCVCCLVPVLVLTQEAAGRVLGWIVGLASLFMLIPAVCALAFFILLSQYLAASKDPFGGEAQNAAAAASADDDYSYGDNGGNVGSSSSSSGSGGGDQFEAGGDGDAGGGGGSHPNAHAPTLAVVVVPLFLMNVLLACLTPLLVRVVNSTHNMIDAMNGAGPQHNGDNDDPDATDNGGVGGGRNRRTMTRPGVEKVLDCNDPSTPQQLFVQANSMLFRRLVQTNIHQAVSSPSSPPLLPAAASASSSSSSSAAALAPAGSSEATAAAGAAAAGGEGGEGGGVATVGSVDRMSGPVTDGNTDGAPASASDNNDGDGVPTTPVLASNIYGCCTREEGGVAETGGVGRGGDTVDGDGSSSSSSGGGGGGKSGDDGSSTSTAATAAVASVEEQREQQCFVCCERRRDSMLQPCGHGGMCYQCAVEFVCSPSPGSRVIDLDTDTGAKCPLCRTPVSVVLRLSSVVGSSVAGSTATFVARTSWTILMPPPPSSSLPPPPSVVVVVPGAQMGESRPEAPVRQQQPTSDPVLGASPGVETELDVIGEEIDSNNGFEGSDRGRSERRRSSDSNDDGSSVGGDIEMGEGGSAAAGAVSASADYEDSSAAAAAAAAAGTGGGSASYVISLNSFAASGAAAGDDDDNGPATDV